LYSAICTRYTIPTLAGVALAATLLLKGPAGLPIVVGALVASIIVLGRARWGAYGVMLLIGIAMCVAAVLPGYLQLRAAGEAIDWSGGAEGFSNLTPKSFSRFFKAFQVPPMLFLFALPVSVGLIGACMKNTYRWPNAPGRRIIATLALTIGISWVVCLASGMVNPRYGYVTLPLLAPLAAGIVMRAMDDPEGTERLKMWAIGSGIGLVIGHVVLSILAAQSTQETSDQIVIIVCRVAGVVAALLAIFLSMKRLSPRVGVCLFVSVALLAPSFAIQDAADAQRRSGITAAAKLREIVGDGATVTAGAILRYQPELFHYAGVNVETFGEDLPDSPHLPGERWVLMSDGEHKKYLANSPERIDSDTMILSNEKPIYVVRLR